MRSPLAHWLCFCAIVAAVAANIGLSVILLVGAIAVEGFAGPVNR